MNTDQIYLQDQATVLIKRWKQLAVADSHIQAVYNQTNSWGLMYNLFPAIWLQADLIEDDVCPLYILKCSKVLPHILSSY